MTYATMSTVRASSLFRRLVDLDMLDDQVAGIEALGIGVRFSVTEKTEQELRRLDGPASFRDAERLACRNTGAFSKH